MHEDAILEGLVCPRDPDVPHLVPRELDDRGTESLNARDLRLRSGVGHNDSARNAEALRMPREGLRHVARTAGVHAPFALRG